jgi:hypothetical protein
MVRIPEGSAPDLKNKSYRITADVEIPEGNAEGVLMTQGRRFNGLGLYLLKGKPVFHYNLVGVERTTVAAKDSLTPGKHTSILDFKYYDGGIGKGGLVTLTVDGKEVADAKLARTIPFRVSIDETLDIGEDTGTPVSEDYQVPFKFTGTITKVVIDLGEAELRLSTNYDREIPRAKDMGATRHRQGCLMVALGEVGNRYRRNSA